MRKAPGKSAGAFYQCGQKVSKRYRFGFLCLLYLKSRIGRKPVSSDRELLNTVDENIEYQLATFGNGCFWCTEAVFKRLKGVIAAVPGYSGGHIENPTYREVCSGETGHAESVQVEYDPSEISYENLLKVFWKTHDPTTRNRQGSDIGSQYRSVIFYHNPQQKKLAEDCRKMLETAEIWSRPIVTELVPFSRFWPAEEYHHDYVARNPSNGYCRVVITPKIQKFESIFRERLK